MYTYIWVNYNDLTSRPSPGNHVFILGEIIPFYGPTIQVSRGFQYLDVYNIDTYIYIYIYIGYLYCTNMIYAIAERIYEYLIYIYIYMI